MTKLKHLAEKFRGARITLELEKEDYDKIAQEELGYTKDRKFTVILDTTEFIIQSK